MKNRLGLVINKDASYPSHQWHYAPSVRYPEYRGGEVARDNNDVYAMVREGLYLMGFDIARFGTPEWNPLGEIIHEGDTVLLKPNMVIHHNPEGGLDCTVTHPSLVRVMTDYVLIALNGTGRVIVGDAPVQSCDFKLMLEKTHYDVLEEYLSNQEVPARLYDFRNTVMEYHTDGRMTPVKNTRAYGGGRIVRMDEKSAFASLDEGQMDRLRITNYTPEALKEHHSNGRHEYLISDALLDADIIINLPKPKTHRKAGMTGAMKNMIGINAEKEYLPHHMNGAKEEGGDEYEKKSVRKSIITEWQEDIDRANRQQDYEKVKRLRKRQQVISLTRKIKKDPDMYREGSWYGNDTIWRTIKDICHIVIYADKDGQLRNSPQRKEFIVADMIVAGQGEGPLLPQPNPMGMILMGEDNMALDLAIARLFGMPEDRIPIIRNTRDHEKESEITLFSTEEQYNGVSLSSMPTAANCVKLPDGWKDIS